MSGLIEEFSNLSTPKKGVIVVCVGCIGIYIILLMLGVLFGSVSDYDDYNSDISSSATTAITPEATKTYGTINLCLSDPDNADLWEGDSLRLWATADKKGLKVSGSLPACGNVRVEILDTETVSGNQYLKIKSDEYDVEGWVLGESVTIDSD